MEDVEVLWDVVAAEEEDMVLAPMVAASLAMVESTPLLHTRRCQIEVQFESG